MKFAGLCAGDESVRAADFVNFAVQNDLYSRVLALGFEHLHDILRGAVAEKLAERLLVIRDAVLFNQRDEVRRRVPGQGGFREVGVGGIEVFRTAVDVREIAAPSAGNKYLFPRAVGAFHDCDAPAAFARLDCAHQPGGSRAQNDRIEFVDHRYGSLHSKARHNRLLHSGEGFGRGSLKQGNFRIPNICYIADRFCRLDFIRPPCDSNHVSSF